MRIPSWFLVLWVIFSITFSIVGSYFSYTQSADRTRELAEIGVIDEDVDIIRVAELITGLEDPNNSNDGNQAAQNPTPQPISPTPMPTNTFTPTPDGPTSTVNPQATEAPTATIAPTDTPAPTIEESQYQIYNDPRRVTVLLLGVDQREGETGPFLTDTMIVLSIDPVSRTGAILSIPRDLWIFYPSIDDSRKINTANRIGEQREFPGGGPAFAKRVVGEQLGIRIDYYIMVNFTAFNTFIDVVGPIEICVTEEIDDDKYPDGSYGYQEVYIPVGCQDMFADTLLPYARTRATSGGDFDRAARQQEVILAIRQKVVSSDGFLSIIGNPVTLWESVQENVRTDMNLEQMVELTLLAETISSDNIRQGQIGAGEVLSGISPSGEDILVPIKGDIVRLVSDLFRPAGEPSLYGE